MRAFTLITVVWTFLALIEQQHAARILGLFPHTGRSHHMVFETLLQELAHRGHNVTVVSFFPLDNPPANYKDISLRGLAPIGIETIDLTFFEHNNRLLDDFYKMSLFLPLADMATSICQKIVEWPELKEIFENNSDYDVILIENFNSDCMLGLAHAYRMDAPVIALLSSLMMPWSYDRLGVNDNPAYVPCISTEFTPIMTFLERLQNVVSHYFLKYWFRYMIQMKEQEIIERHVGRKITDLEVVAKNISAMFINTHHSLNGGIPMVPGLIEVGGMHLTSPNNRIPLHVERFLNESHHGVVLFSFGSLIKTASMPKYKEDIIVKVLNKLPQRVIWKHESSTDDGIITGNILRLKWIPQRALLNHPKILAFIAHGGILGMSEALDAGVPMLVIPFFGDQPANGAAATKAGFAKVLKYIDITENALHSTLQEVLNPQMRENAVRLSRIWHDRPMSPLNTAVYWVERTARLGHVPNLGTPANHLLAHQAALLDVGITIFIVITVSLLLILFLLKNILNLITTIVNVVYYSKSKKQKEH